MSSVDEKNPALMMNRREAIKRTAMMLGAAVSASTIAGCMGGGSEATAGANWTPPVPDQSSRKGGPRIGQRYIPTV